MSSEQAVLNAQWNAAEMAFQAEVARLRDALNDIQARGLSGYFVDAAHLGDIARNALKESGL